MVQEMFTLHGLTLLFSIMFLLGSPASSQEISITMDDFRLNDDPILTATEKDERVLASLAKNNIEIALFVIGREAVRPLARERLAVWDRTNHLIANHTYTHGRAYNRMTFAELSEEIQKTDDLLAAYRNFRRYFRFPALKEGDTREKRDQIRAFLRQRGYRYGYVTIDGSDWYINARLINRLRQNPNADLEPFRDYYLRHLWDRAQFYDGLSKQVLGRSVKHTLLIHHNLLNALYLDDIIDMFRSKGWKFVSAGEAFQDGVFQLEPDIVPAGESILWGLAKETGRFDNVLRYPAEGSEYEQEAMDQLGL
jgi:peptidoglycan-N-acetylglucosamine deacetylase